MKSATRIKKGVAFFIYLIFLRNKIDLYFYKNFIRKNAKHLKERIF